MTQSRTTVTNQMNKSFYFDRKNPQDLKDKHEFREKFDSPESKQRCLDIWHQFSDDKTTASSTALKVNLHLKIN